MREDTIRCLACMNQAKVDSCNLRENHYRPLACDNRKFFSKEFFQDLADLTTHLAQQSGYPFDEQSWRIFPHHVAGWPKGMSCKMQPNIGFSCDGGDATLRIGFGVNVNPGVSTEGAWHLSELHDRARNSPDAFDELGVAIGGYVETPIADGHCRFRDAVPPPSAAIGVDWWFYGCLAGYPADGPLLGDNEAIARRLTDTIRRTRAAGFWVD